MRHTLITILLALVSIGLYAQDDITLFFLNDGTFKGYYNEEIDSISYSHYDIDSIWHTEVVMQDIWSCDTVCRIPLEMIDSITHQIPAPKYKSETINLDERYLPYIVSVDGMNITFSAGLPLSLKPRVGDVLLYEGSSDLFPNGFAGKVVVEGTTVSCEPAGISDIYERIVFFGCYALVDNGFGDRVARRVSYREAKMAKLMHSSNPSKITGGNDGTLPRRAGNNDSSIEDWRMGGDALNDFSLGTFKTARKISFKKIHSTVAADISVTPIISVEFAYDLYLLNPVFFFKCKQIYNFTIKAQASSSLDWNLTNKDKKPFWGVDEPDWVTVEMEELDSNENDTEDCQSAMLIDQTVPIPDIPVLKVGFKLGFFLEMKAEMEAVIGAKFNGSVERTYIYNLDKDNWIYLSDDWRDYMYPWRFLTGEYLKRGTSQWGKGPTSWSTDWSLDISGKCSTWFGLLTAGNVSLGINKNSEVKEELSLRYGPYAEMDVKADIKNGVADKSWYQLLEQSKFKYTDKLGLNLKFTAKLKNEKLGVDCGYEDTQFSWSPKSGFYEKERYFLPKFEAPEYSISGNTLKCSSKISRPTLSNTVGFTIYDEVGNKIDQKFNRIPYFYSDDEMPFDMSETFTGLNFKNHRYTIVPTTRVFDWDFLQFEVPTESQTCILCPDSHHPHVIDLGLPSGTKWLCTNVYADTPEMSGGYYQWGQTAQSLSCEESNYSTPSLVNANISGTEYDAASANLGHKYQTPTKNQFEELLQNCKLEIKGSDWYPISINSQEGLFLKGKNGNNLYLPFGGRMSDTGIKGLFNDVGYYMLSDYDSSDSNRTSALKIDGKDYVTVPAKWYGYSVRPFVLDEFDDLCFSDQSLEFEGNIYQEVAKTLILENNGNAVIEGTITQATSPFHVYDSFVGDFHLQPRDTLAIIVSFAPEDPIEYTSSFSIIYGNGSQSVEKKIVLKGTGLGHGSAPDTHEYVDLGLPSGTLWATCNVGANTPEEYGGYYAWGETEEKDYYGWNNYNLGGDYMSGFTKYCTDSELGIVDNKTQLDPEDDVVHVKWGDDWRMPTITELEELHTQCTWNWAPRGGVNGCEVKGPNGNTIFIPATGYRDNDSQRFAGSAVFLWSSELHPNFSFYAMVSTYQPGGSKGIYREFRNTGRMVRPVRTSASPSVLVTSITIKGSSAHIKQDETLQLRAEVKPENATNKSVVWSSDDTSVATVSDDGLVTAVGSGQVIIKATAKDGSGVSDSFGIIIDPSGLYANSMTVTNIYDTRATFTADFGTREGATIEEKGYCYSSVETQPTVDNATKDVIWTSGSIDFGNSSTVYDLAPDTRYYVCAYVANEQEIVYSEVVEFRTEESQWIMTYDAEKITASSAFICGKFGTGKIEEFSECGFCYSATENNPMVDNSNLVKMSSYYNFDDVEERQSSTTLTGLSSFTTYYYRAYGISPQGEVHYGKIMKFTTREPYVAPFSVSTDYIDMGAVEFGETSEADFSITNLTDEAITIEDFSGLQSSFDFDWSGGIMMPKETRNIHIVFDPTSLNDRGFYAVQYNFQIKVEYTPSDQITYLSVYGSVKR